MSIINHTHLPWCDPRICAPISDTATDHRSAPLSFVAAGGMTVSVGLSRLDSNLPELSWFGAVLELRDEDGRRTACDLSAIDCRILAALLVGEAERIEAATR